MSKNNNVTASEAEAQTTTNSKSKGSGKKRRANYHNNKRTASVEAQHTTGDINDSTFYYKDNLLRDQINDYSFDSFLGRKIEFTASDPCNVSNAAPANLLAYYVNPSIAPTGPKGSAKATGINLAAMKNYLDYSQNNNNNTKYGPEDPIGATLAVGELIKMISFATRCFGLLNYFDKRNWAAPSIYFSAMEIDWEDFRANAARYRIKLNTLIASVDTLPIPLNIKYLEKCGNWFKYIYVDETGPMPQTIMFVPYSTWVLDEAGTEEGSVLTTTPVIKNQYVENLDTWDDTFQRVLDIIAQQIRALATSSTMQFVFADILRMASQGHLQIGNLAGVPDGYYAEFVKSDEIRLMIHNSVIIGPPVPQDWRKETYTAGGNTGNNDVWLSASEAGLLYNPEFWSCAQNGAWWDEITASQQSSAIYSNPGLTFAHNLLVDFPNEPTAEDKVSATRLSARGVYKHVADKTHTGYSHYYCNNMAIGDAYIVKAIIYLDESAKTYVKTIRHDWSGAGYTPWSTYSMLSKLTDFNFGPMTYLTHGDDSKDGPTGYQNIIECGELNYFTLLDDEFMRPMYEAEMLGLFEAR